MGAATASTTELGRGLGQRVCRYFDHLLLSVGSAAFTLLCALAAVTTIAVAAATATAFFSVRSSV